MLSVPEKDWAQFEALCASEGVEATIIGKFTDTKQLVLKYGEHKVGEVSMHFLHDGRPPVIREAVYDIKSSHLAGVMAPINPTTPTTSSRSLARLTLLAKNGSSASTTTKSKLAASLSPSLVLTTMALPTRPSYVLT